MNGASCDETVGELDDFRTDTCGIRYCTSTDGTAKEYTTVNVRLPGRAIAGGLTNYVGPCVTIGPSDGAKRREHGIAILN